ncbi:MAG: hypothetical protein NZ811_08480 [Gammaproteobacteria bacterium]|jgi:hypothetical protein|nr:hypothetical protein [Gammaproteobacteria bacterium]|tara:strand:+ start:2107 stop:2277 length:171 start_codon:yes stop_codon:yes gene_type:complete
MENIIIKSDEQRRQEAYVLERFGKNSTTADKASREHAEIIARKTQEAYAKLKRMER